MSARKAKFYPVSQGVQLGEYSVHCLADLRAIGSRLIVIEGDPGSGKTTLLRQLIKVVRPLDTIVVATALTGWQRRFPELARRARVFNLGKGGKR